MHYEHSFIFGKKMNSFGQTMVEIFNFFFGCVTYGPPCSFDLQIHFVNIDGSRSAIQIGSQLNVKRGSKQVIPSDSIRIACTLN